MTKLNLVPEPLKTVVTAPVPAPKPDDPAVTAPPASTPAPAGK